MKVTPQEMDAILDGVKAFRALSLIVSEWYQERRALAIQQNDFTPEQLAEADARFARIVADPLAGRTPPPPPVVEPPIDPGPPAPPVVPPVAGPAYNEWLPLGSAKPSRPPYEQGDHIYEQDSVGSGVWMAARKDSTAMSFGRLVYVGDVE